MGNNIKMKGKEMITKEKRTENFKVAQLRQLASERRRCPRLRPVGLKDKAIWNYNPKTGKVECE
jgi:hypothetical protein